MQRSGTQQLLVVCTWPWQAAATHLPFAAPCCPRPQPTPTSFLLPPETTVPALHSFFSPAQSSKCVLQPGAAGAAGSSREQLGQPRTARAAWSSLEQLGHREQLGQPWQLGQLRAAWSSREQPGQPGAARGSQEQPEQPGQPDYEGWPWASSQVILSSANLTLEPSCPPLAWGDCPQSLAHTPVQGQRRRGAQQG